MSWHGGKFPAKQAVLKEVLFTDISKTWSLKISRLCSYHLKSLKSVQCLFGWWQSSTCLSLACCNGKYYSTKSGSDKGLYHWYMVSRLEGGSPVVCVHGGFAWPYDQALSRHWKMLFTQQVISRFSLCSLVVNVRYHMYFSLVWLRCSEWMNLFAHCSLIGLPFRNVSQVPWILEERVSVLSDLISGVFMEVMLLHFSWDFLLTLWIQELFHYASCGFLKGKWWMASLSHVVFSLPSLLWAGFFLSQ